MRDKENDEILKDYLCILKYSHLYFEEQNDVEVCNIIKKVFVEHKVVLNNNKTTKKHLSSIKKFIDIINTFDRQLVLEQGNKLSGTTTIHSG